MVAFCRMRASRILARAKRQANARHDPVPSSLLAPRILQIDAANDAIARKVTAAIKDPRSGGLRHRKEVAPDPIVAEPAAILRKDAPEKLLRTLASLVAYREDVQPRAAVRRGKHPPLRRALSGVNSKHVARVLNACPTLVAQGGPSGIGRHRKRVRQAQNQTCRNYAYEPDNGTRAPLHHGRLTHAPKTRSGNLFSDFRKRIPDVSRRFTALRWPASARIAPSRGASAASVKSVARTGRRHPASSRPSGRRRCPSYGP